MLVQSFLIDSRSARGIAVIICFVAFTACRVDADGDYDSLSAGGSTEGESAGDGSTGGVSSAGSGGTGGLSDTDVFPPSEDACEFEFGANPTGAGSGGAEDCSVDADCCSGFGADVAYACPSDVYPNNWRCESGDCVQRSSPSQLGCASDDDCGFQGFDCVTISGVGHCVGLCVTDTDCEVNHNMPHSTCETVSAHKFCMQVVP